MTELDLSAAVQQALTDASISGRVIAQETAIPGVVRLTGQVISEDEKLRADQAARGVSGVLDVMDEIILRRPSTSVR